MTTGLAIRSDRWSWVPAFAGTTGKRESRARRPGSRDSGYPGPMTTGPAIRSDRWSGVPAFAGTTERFCAQDEVGRDFEPGIELGPLAVAHRVRAPLRGARLARAAQRGEEACGRERLGHDRAGVGRAHVVGIAAYRGRDHRQAID